LSILPNLYGVIDGVTRGLMGLGQGVLGAATGVISLPIEAGKEGGWGLKGVLKGVGKGLVGVILKPVGGAAEFVAQTSDGIMYQAGIGVAAGPHPMRRKKRLQWEVNTGLQLDWKILPKHEQRLFHRMARIQIQAPETGDEKVNIYNSENNCFDRDCHETLLVSTKEYLRVFLRLKSHGDLLLVRKLRWEDFQIKENRETPRALQILSGTESELDSENEFTTLIFATAALRREFASLAMQRLLLRRKY